MVSHASLLSAIGNTPLVQIPFPSQARIYAKLEYLNPGGSVKDRSALFMVEQAEKNGTLVPGGTLIDASSGNHGIAIALIGVIKGYKVIITAPDKSSTEKIETMRAYGADIVLCPATKYIGDPKSYHSIAQKIHEETPNSFMPNQYYNEQNSLAHYTLLAPEIWQQTEGSITHFFAAAGSGGTISGVGKFLKEKNPTIKVYGLDAATSFYATKGFPEPYKVESMGIDFDSCVMNHSVIDEIIGLHDNEIFPMLKVLAHRYGFLVGPSSAAVAHAVYQRAAEFTHDDVIVMIFGDSGRAYLSKNFYSGEMQEPTSIAPHNHVYTSNQL